MITFCPALTKTLDAAERQESGSDEGGWASRIGAARHGQVGLVAGGVGAWARGAALALPEPGCAAQPALSKAALAAARPGPEIGGG